MTLSTHTFASVSPLPNRANDKPPTHPRPLGLVNGARTAQLPVAQCQGPEMPISESESVWQWEVMPPPERGTMGSSMGEAHGPANPMPRLSPLPACPLIAALERRPQWAGQCHDPALADGFSGIPHIPWRWGQPSSRGRDLWKRDTSVAWFFLPQAVGPQQTGHLQEPTFQPTSVAHTAIWSTF